MPLSVSIFVFHLCFKIIIINLFQCLSHHDRDTTFFLVVLRQKLIIPAYVLGMIFVVDEVGN